MNRSTLSDINICYVHTTAARHVQTISMYVRKSPPLPPTRAARSSNGREAEAPGNCCPSRRSIGAAGEAHSQTPRCYTLSFLLDCTSGVMRVTDQNCVLLRLYMYIDNMKIQI